MQCQVRVKLGELLIPAVDCRGDLAADGNRELEEVRAGEEASLGHHLWLMNNDPALLANKNSATTRLLQRDLKGQVK